MNLVISYGKAPFVAIELIELMDIFLIATVLFIFALGMYELFIDSVNLPEWLIIRNLHDLKVKLSSVIILVMSITFWNTWWNGSTHRGLFTLDLRSQLLRYPSLHLDILGGRIKCMLSHVRFFIILREIFRKNLFTIALCSNEYKAVIIWKLYFAKILLVSILISLFAGCVQQALTENTTTPATTQTSPPTTTASSLVKMRLATTTSTCDTKLLDVFNKKFEEKIT